MDRKTSLDWYCSGNILDEEDLQILENQYKQVIESRDLENSFEVAPKHICNQTEIPEGSSWISAVAVVLDRLIPIQDRKPRRLVVDQLKDSKAVKPSLYKRVEHKTPDTQQRPLAGGKSPT